MVLENKRQSTWQYEERLYSCMEEAMNEEKLRW